MASRVTTVNGTPNKIVDVPSNESITDEFIYLNISKPVRYIIIPNRIALKIPTELMGSIPILKSIEAKHIG